MSIFRYTCGKPVLVRSPNMNVNEVISNRAIQLLGGVLGSQQPIGPNDDVNMGQSSNDSFPTAMHIAALTVIDERLVPSLEALSTTIERKADAWMQVIKVGPYSFRGCDSAFSRPGMVWLGCATSVPVSQKLGTRERVCSNLRWGARPVGTGLNAPKGFSKNVAAKIAELTSKPFVTAPNKFMAQGSLDAMVRASAGLRGVAVSLMKIANDMRWLASGPRCGLGELQLPANETGLLDHARQGQSNAV